MLGFGSSERSADSHVSDSPTLDPRSQSSWFLDCLECQGLEQLEEGGGENVLLFCHLGLSAPGSWGPPCLPQNAEATPRLPSHTRVRCDGSSGTQGHQLGGFRTNWTVPTHTCENSLVEHPGERGETGLRGEPGSGPFRDGHSSPTCRLQLQTWHQVGRTWGQERARSRGAR